MNDDPAAFAVESGALLAEATRLRAENAGPRLELAGMSVPDRVLKRPRPAESRRELMFC